MSVIECRKCTEPKCDGCNLFSLSQMLRAGKLDNLMDEHRSINPAADVRPNVHGRWEYMECSVGRLLVNFPCCSECKATFMIPMESAKCAFKFCPNCGAEMEVIRP